MKLYTKKIILLAAIGITGLVHAACYEYPGFGWRWEDQHVGRVLTIYDRVRLDLTERECDSKLGQVIVAGSEWQSRV